MADTFTPEQIAQILEAFFDTVGTRQYIGARYVPIFGRKNETSIVWDNSAPYEPLTIVLYQGNSYTSRQYVPAGVEITNTLFWANTGNYNAQVEEYRRETARAQQTAQNAQNDIDALLPKADFSESVTVKQYIDTQHQAAMAAAQGAQNDINILLPKADFSAELTVKNYIDNNIETLSEKSFTKADVRRYGAVEGASNNDWNAILTELSNESDSIYFPAGNWDLNGGIVIPENVVRVCGAGARLFSSTNCEYLMSITTRYTMFFGLTFDGMGRVEKLLYSAGNEIGNRPSPVIGCSFLNIGSGHYGIYNGYIGLHIVGCTFNTTEKSGAVYGGICIRTHTDNMITSCKFFRFDHAILALGSNVSNCYFWTRESESGIVLAPENFIDNYADASQTYDSVFTNCEFDCIKTICYNPRNVTVFACQFYWNDRDISTDCNLFMLSTGKNKIGSLTFSNNIIKFQEISYDVNMFSSDAIRQGISHSAFIAGYVSKGNIMTTSVYSMASLERYKLLCGWVPINDYVRSGSRNIVSYLQCNVLNTYPSARYSITANLFRYDRIRANEGNDQRAIYLFSPLRTGVKPSVKVFWNDNTPNEVLPFGSFAINSIEVEVAPLLMIAQNNYSTTDFDPTGYQSVDCQAVTFS